MKKMEEPFFDSDDADLSLVIHEDSSELDWSFLKDTNIPPPAPPTPPAESDESKQSPKPFLEDGSVVTLELVPPQRERKKGAFDLANKPQLFAHVSGYENATKKQKNSHNKCYCWVNGKKLDDQLILIGNETKKEPPFYILERKDGLEYRVTLYDPGNVLQLDKGKVREREEEEEEDYGPQKKAKGSTTKELLDDLKKTNAESEIAKLFPLLERIVDGLEGLGVGDTAYRHSIGDNKRPVQCRDIVGLVGDRVCLDVSAASFVSVVAYEDWVASARNPRRVCHDKSALVVYMGRTQVKVHRFDDDGRSPLFVVPDGENNGVGRVVAADQVKHGDTIVGLYGGHVQGDESIVIVDIIIFPSADRPALERRIREMSLTLELHEKRICKLEREMEKLSIEPSKDACDILMGLQQMYLMLQMENALDELTMNLTDDVYIEPRLMLREKKTFTTEKSIWSQVSNGDGPVLLLGDKGIGKSTFVRYECLKWAKDRKVGAFGGYDFVFYVDLRVVFSEGRRKFWKGEAPISLESVVSVYLEHMDCFETACTKQQLKELRGRSCYIFDGFDYAESCNVPGVQEFLNQLCVGKIRGINYMLICSPFVVKDNFQPRGEITVCGFEECNVPKYIAAVAKAAPQWNLDVKNLAKTIRNNEQLSELSKTPLFLLMCCVASKDLARLGKSDVVVLSDIFNLAFGRLLDQASERKACVEFLSRLGVQWWKGEDLEDDPKTMHACGVVRTGLVCATDWRQRKEADGSVHQHIRWSHDCIASFYFAQHVLKLLESDHLDEVKSLMVRFDFFMWRVMFGLSRGEKKSLIRTKLMDLWIELHTQFTDRMFERGLFWLPEFEGIEDVLKKGGSNRPLAHWLMFKGKWKEALDVAILPSLDKKEWSMEMANDAACIGEIYMHLGKYDHAIKYLHRSWDWWCDLPENETKGHWRDCAMVALKCGQCLRSLKCADWEEMIVNAFKMCCNYAYEFDIQDRIMIYEAMDETEGAPEGLKKAITEMHVAHGHHTHSWASRLVLDGHAHLERRELEKARACFVRAIEIDDMTLDIDDVERASPLNGLGCTYLMQNRMQEARRYFEMAAELWNKSSQKGSKEHARILANLAVVVEQKHGLQLIRQALNYDPDCLEYQMILQVLKGKECH